MPSTVSGDGRITIEKKLRDELGVRPGCIAIQRRVGDRIEIRFLPPPHRGSLRGVLADPDGPSFPTEAELHEATEEAWAEAVAGDARTGGQY